MEEKAKIETKKSPELDLVTVEKALTTILLNLEIPTRTMGYFYSRECAKIICFNPVSRFQMNELVFKEVATKYKTSSSSIERSIRHLLSSKTTQNSLRKFNTIFNVTANFNMIHPSVCEFLCLLAECVNFVHA